MQWITIFRGPMWEALALQAKLEAHGVPVFLPDAAIKTIDPLITGADAFGVSLQVPESAISEARELVKTEREQGREALPLPDDEPLQEPREAALAKQGRHLRWAAAFGLIFPPAAVWGVFLLVDYLSASRRVNALPPGHRYNLLAGSISVAVILAYVLMYLNYRG